MFPSELVDGVVAEAGRREQRQRLLPARVVVYYVLALALFADCSYEEVMRQLVEGLAWESGWRQAWGVPSKVAIYKARRAAGAASRLSFCSGRRLCRWRARRRGGRSTGGLRLVSLDGTCLDVADTPANDEAFGRPGSSRREGGGAFPQLRLVGLAESGTHAIFDAALGPYSSSEQELADRLWGALGEGMLCLADRGFYSFERFQRARATGAQLLWRVNGAHAAATRAATAQTARTDPRLATQQRPAVASGPASGRVVEYRAR